MKVKGRGPRGAGGRLEYGKAPITEAPEVETSIFRKPRGALKSHKKE